MEEDAESDRSMESLHLSDIGSPSNHSAAAVQESIGIRLVILYCSFVINKIC